MKLFWIFGLGLALITPALPAAAQETPGTTPIALVEEAYVAHRKGEYDKAIKAYTAIIQRRGLTKRERAVSYLLRGEAKRDAGKLNDAVLDFTRALRQWPGYPQAHFFRGRVYERQGKFMEAYADMARAVELDPEREPYQTALAVLKKRMTESGLKIPTAPPQPLEPKLPLEDNS
ncbi:tetratricopeptide repeat protein [Deltaproteobacteria bacterium OttesenSCG-928-K17]|nr:tetratricopeptide repeat protein [Deltaproteobacteria bacterium OttesenSCG-928-K17]